MEKESNLSQRMKHKFIGDNLTKFLLIEDVKAKIQKTQFRLKEILSDNRDDFNKIPIHTLEKRGSHSKTPEEMRQIGAEQFDYLLKVIDKIFLEEFGRELINDK